MQNSLNTLKYVLSLVEQDISILEAQRIDIIDRFLTSASWTERDINHGKLLALAKVKGRLEAMIEGEALKQQLASITTEYPELI
jgi:hypothetical protein